MHPNKSRSDFIKECRAQDPQAKNTAIQSHIRKLEAMTDEEWPAHRAHLSNLAQRARSTANRLASETLAKTRKTRKATTHI